jgi:hypothetical protein
MWGFLFPINTTPSFKTSPYTEKKFLENFVYLWNMKYIITEDRLLRIFDNYMDNEFADITITTPKGGDEGYVQFKTSNGGIVMDGYIGDHLLVSPRMWNTIKELFNLNYANISDLIEKWTESRYGLTWEGNVLMDVAGDLV